MKTAGDHVDMQRKKLGYDFAAVGPESADHAKAWRDAMDWVRLEIDYPDLKRSFCEWAKTARDADELAHWEGLDAWQFATVGRITFCMQQGAVAPEDTSSWFEAKVSELAKLKVKIVDAEPERKLTVQQRRNIEYVDIYSRLEAVCNKFAAETAEIEPRVRKLMAAYQPNQQMLKRLYDHFKESFSDAMRDRDNPEVAKTVEPILIVVNVLALSTGNAKAVADSRGATAKSIKQASKVKYKQVDMDTAVASVSPAMIPGSNYVVLYNAKNRKVSIYAAGADGLGIKGTKITGYDEDHSYSKILRKPKQTLPTLRDATNSKRVDKIMGEYIKGKRHTVNGRMTKDTLLIKVFK